MPAPGEGVEGAPVVAEVAGAAPGEGKINPSGRRTARVKLIEKQGGELGNELYMLRGKGDSDFPLYPLNNP